MAWVGKKYKYVKGEKFEDYMKAAGVGLVQRKMGAAWTPSVELIKNGDEYILKSTSTVRNTEVKFKNGVEFDETTADGRKMKTTFTFDGENKLIQQQNGDIPNTITREFTETTLVTTLTAKDVTAVRHYEAE